MKQREHRKLDFRDSTITEELLEQISTRHLHLGILDVPGIHENSNESMVVSNLDLS